MISNKIVSQKHDEPLNDKLYTWLPRFRCEVNWFCHLSVFVISKSGEEITNTVLQTETEK